MLISNITAYLTGYQGVKPHPIGVYDLTKVDELCLWLVQLHSCSSKVIGKCDF